MSVQLTGIGVSRGIAIGEAHVLQRGEIEVTEYAIPQELLDDEVRRFRQALEIARGQLRDIRNRIPEGTRADIVEFIDTHLLMLEDSTLTVAPEHLIVEQQVNAEWALKQQRDALVQVFEEMDDPYLRTRKDDIDHVVSRIQRILQSGDVHNGITEDVSLEGSILFADELTPADTVLMQHQGIAAFVTEYGGPLSHTAIIARSLHIPAVVGAHEVRRYVRDRELVIVDGERGVVIADPDERTLAEYRARQAAEQARVAGLVSLRDQAARTRDGLSIRLLGNIELTEDVAEVLNNGAEGVGLYRTEFLFMNRDDLPGEEEQLEQYTRVMAALGGRPLTIRTLDLGADKPLEGHERPCTNPALGLRAIRLCLHDPALFLPQLRAILRASARGPVRMMIPMLSGISELEQVLALVREARAQLDAEGLEHDPRLPIGAMIEVPSAALTARAFARRLDFLSIGTNDLIQYTLAIDRVDDEVNYLYDPTHPAVLELIHRVIEAGRAENTPVAMCGEMAGDPNYTRLLLGLGLTEFSMQPAALLEVKGIVNNSEASRLRPLALALLEADEASERRRLLAHLGPGQTH
ncbi:phosphoenolpyruvate--protein phosphotransferase [Thiohalobacter sp.]|uniref:phosphoenolpyruvate--protein phosphotransferase n=1 Tax=Thiohalobacter sp. TaxID=2025948 RepID=UPI00260F821A|nr:phosphoenolpyruvate--protein phosphotransferase [Thiohalobacter sp.]